MTHSEIRESLAVYRDLFGAERQEVDHHLATCAECAATLEAYQQMDRGLSELRDARPDERLRERSYAGQGAGRGGRATRPVFLRLGLAPLAGMLLVVVLVAALAVWQGTLVLPVSTASQPAGGGDPLTRSEWVLLTLNGQAPLPGTHVSLAFAAGKLSGFAGCNHYRAGYSARDGALQFGTFVSNLAGCTTPPGVLDQERAYLDALQASTQYQVVEDRLELTDASSGQKLVYARQPARTPQDPAALAGVWWRLISMNAASPAPGAPIMLMFAGGALQGSAGCRDYAGTYTATSEGINFTFIEMLGKLCPDESLRSQEGVYTDRLGASTRYEVNSTRLELSSDRGDNLVFEAIPAGAWPVATPLAQVATPAAISIPASPTMPAGLRDWETTQVQLDIFSGLPNPAWQLTAEGTQELRTLVEALPEAPCRQQDLGRLGYRGFVVLLAQRPELSNEYRLRIYGGQIRYGDPWALNTPGLCYADIGRQVERHLLNTGRQHLAENVYAVVVAELEQGDPVATPAGARPVGGDPFTLQEGLAFMPPSGWHFISRDETGEPPEVQYLFRPSDTREAQNLPGEADLIVRIMPGRNLEDWPQEWDGAPFEVAFEEAQVEGRPALRLQMGSPRPGWTVSVGTQLVIQDGDRLVLLAASCADEATFSRYSAAIEQALESIRFDAAP